MTQDRRDGHGLRTRRPGQRRGEVHRDALRSGFGSNAQLRSVAEVYAGSDDEARFAEDFVKLWDKVMMLDRYDVRS